MRETIVSIKANSKTMRNMELEIIFSERDNTLVYFRMASSTGKESSYTQMEIIISVILLIIKSRAGVNSI